MHDDFPEVASITALAVVLALALGMWAGGAAATLAWSGHMPRPGPTSAVTVMIHNLSAPGKPSAAWSESPGLPPTPVLVGAELGGALLCLALLFAGLVVARRGSSPTRRRAIALRRLLEPATDDRGGWARSRDLATLRVADPTAGRLTLGHSGRHLLAAEARASVIVLGPSQSGKTTGLAIPAILEWQGPVIATSVKTDLVRDTIDRRAARAPAWVYDPTGSTGLATSTWSPLAACATWQGARRSASWLCSSARRTMAGSGDEDFWYAAAAKLLAPYLLAAASSGRDMRQVVQWIDTQEDTEIAHILEAGGDYEALGAAGASWQRDERTRSSVFTTAEMVLEAFADPSVLESAASSEIDPAVLLGSQAATLYVCAPGHEQERLRPVFTTLLQTFITAAYDRSGRTGSGRTGSGPHRPLLIVLDEAANIAPLSNLDALASTVAGHGIQLVTVWQDLAQLRARYGERAATVVNNHRAKIVLSGISDPATLEYASALIGDGEVGDHSVTIDAKGARSTTRSRRDRRLAPDASLRRIRPGEGVLVYGHLRPARIRLRPWFETRPRRRPC